MGDHRRRESSQQQQYPPQQQPLLPPPYDAHSHHSHHSHHHHLSPPPHLRLQPQPQPQPQPHAVAAGHNHAAAADDDETLAPAAPRPTLLQPRVAVVLGVPRRWHPVLFACRLLSVGPAIFWSLSIALGLVVQLHALLRLGAAAGRDGGSGSAPAPAPAVAGDDVAFEKRLRLTETTLAMIWCGASAYLSFFFTDCLMSRWLLNYTPQATIVRLLAINALNGYLTKSVLDLTGGAADHRLLLPAWVGIATTLTALYHLTQRKINIRKETSISISVFSAASFISMVSLLAQLYSTRADFPDIPLITLATRAWVETLRVVANVGNTGGREL